MIFYIVLIGMISLYKLEFQKGKNYYSDYMSIEKSTAIKGIFILLVFSRHISSYIKFNNYLDNSYVIIDKFLGQLIVSMFLFYSGYGVFESIKSKGKKYIDQMPIKRVLNLLFNFDLAILIFCIVDIFIGKHYGIKRVLLSFIGWDEVGNSNWYIFCILITYIFTYISFKTFEKRYNLAIIGVTILSLFFISFMSNYKDTYWYNTILCYVSGMWFSYYRKQIENIVLESNLTYIFTVAISIFAFIFFRKYKKYIMVYELQAIMFTVIIAFITMKVSVYNKVLYWLGKNLFGLYILQRVPMIIFKHIGLDKYGNYLYFILSFICTLILAILFNKLIKMINWNDFYLRFKKV